MIAATVGSAVGLGTVWRFPAETQANGGGAFLLVYIICVFLLGVPVMLGEFSLGRSTRMDAVGSFQKLSPGAKWWIFGALAVLASYLIDCFYMVVGGWTLEYLWHSITGGLFDNPMGVGADALYHTKMEQYILSPWEPMIATWIIVLANVGILLAGVKKGIERLSNIMMPALFILLTVFCCYALSLPGAMDGVTYFLHPDFSRITPGVCISALGQALFSLSLGMGILITYSSYFPNSTRLTRTSLIVSAMTLVVALLMGLVIFPAAASFGLQDHAMGGTTLVFQTMPHIFARMPMPQFWAIAFFLLLLMAAITSTVSISEVSVAFVKNKFKVSRRRAIWIVMLPLLVFSAICSLSLSDLSWLTLFGNTIFDFLDMLTNNFMLPIVALGTTVFVGWFAPRGLLQGQLTNHGEIRGRMFGFVLFVIRYIAPLAIVAIFLSNLNIF